MDPKVLKNMTKDYRHSEKKIHKNKHIERHNIANQIRNAVHEELNFTIYNNVEQGSFKTPVYSEQRSDNCKQIKKAVKVLDNYAGFDYKLKELNTNSKTCEVYMKWK